MTRVIPVFLIMFFFQFGYTQIVNRTSNYIEEKEDYKRDSKSFTSLKKVFRDSISTNSLITASKNDFHLFVNPVFDFSYGRQKHIK